MPDDADQQLEAELREQELSRLFLSARLCLKRERLDDAQATVDRLHQLLPDSSEVCELQGDLHRRRGKRKDAQEAYKRAFDLDNANVDAERKYAEMVLFLGEEDRARKRQQELFEDPSKRRPQPRNPVLSVLYSLLFPGFGQLYNRMHERGLVLLAGAAILLMLVVNALVIVPMQKMSHEPRPRGGLSLTDQFDLWRDQLHQLPGWEWLLIVLGVLAFTALQVYSAIDAYLVAKQEAREAEQLGI